MDNGGGPCVLTRYDSCMHPRMQLGGTLGGGEGHKLVDSQGWPSRGTTTAAWLAPMLPKWPLTLA